MKSADLNDIQDQIIHLGGSRSEVFNPKVTNTNNPGAAITFNTIGLATWTGGTATALFGVMLEAGRTIIGIKLRASGNGVATLQTQLDVWQGSSAAAQIPTPNVLTPPNATYALLSYPLSVPYLVQEGDMGSMQINASASGVSVQAIEVVYKP